MRTSFVLMCDDPRKAAANRRRIKEGGDPEKFWRTVRRAKFIPLEQMPKNVPVDSGNVQGRVKIHEFAEPAPE